MENNLLEPKAGETREEIFVHTLVQDNDNGDLIFGATDGNAYSIKGEGKSIPNSLSILMFALTMNRKIYVYFTSDRSFTKRIALVY
jgi:hypothetical protein